MYLEFKSNTGQVIREKDGNGKEHLYSLFTWKIVPLKMDLNDDVEEHYHACYEYLNSLYDHIKFTCEPDDVIRFLVESDKRLERGLWVLVEELTPQYLANVFDAYFIQFNTSRTVRTELMESSLELIVVRKTPYIKSFVNE